MQALGRRLGQAACRGDVLVLDGPLGAGKTTLTQGLGAGLGVADQIVSPTFVVLREYAGRLPLYHFDLYRFEGSARAADLEFGDYVDGGDGVSVIEWPSHAPELLPASYLRLSLRYGDSNSGARTLTVEAIGVASRRLLDAVAGADRS